jgi:hypothetical protein
MQQMVSTRFAHNGLSFVQVTVLVTLRPFLRTEKPDDSGFVTAGNPSMRIWPIRCRSRQKSEQDRPMPLSGCSRRRFHGGTTTPAIIITRVCLNNGLASRHLPELPTDGSR